MVAVAVLVAVVGIVLVVREGKGGGGGAKSSSGPHTSATSASNTPPRPITVVGLASAHLDQWKNLTSTPLDAPPITGDYAHFDVVANLDWASSIATAWSPDATLWRLYAQGVTPDGVVNVSTGGKGSVILQFNSVAKGDLDLMIELHIPRGVADGAPGAHVNVSISSHGDETARDRLPKPTCTVPRVFSVLHGSLKDANSQYETSLGLVVYGAKSYWVVGYATGVAQVRGVEDFVNATTCAIEHPK
jgi:hypothetical protein